MVPSAALVQCLFWQLCGLLSPCVQGYVPQVILLVAFLQLKVSACVFGCNYKQQQPVTMLIVKTEKQLAQNSICFAVVRWCWHDRLGAFRPPPVSRDGCFLLPL